MKEILKNKIEIVEDVLNWREGVLKAGEILLNKNIIEKRYIDAAIQNIEKLGTYIILEDGVAMPHARPEEGTLETGISLLVVKNGVSFSKETEKVNLIFMLSAKDNSSHIDIIRKLSVLIDDEEMIKNIVSKNSEEEILNII